MKQIRRECRHDLENYNPILHRDVGDRHGTTYSKEDKMAKEYHKEEMKNWGSCDLRGTDLERCYGRKEGAQKTRRICRVWIPLAIPW